MKKTWYLTAVLGLAVLSTGCAKPYAMPAEGAPAAILKIKMAYDHAKALAVIPAEGHNRRIDVDVTLMEENKKYVLAKKAYPDVFAGGITAAPLEVLALRLQPDRTASVTVRLSVAWSTTAPETVYKEERTPKQVSKQESYYNYSTKRTEYRTVTVTEYDVVRKPVVEPVTRHHSSGCHATVTLRPERDKTYLLDYSNLLVSEGCSLQGYLQAPQADGTFKLIGI